LRETGVLMNNYCCSDYVYGSNLIIVLGFVFPLRRIQSFRDMSRFRECKLLVPTQFDDDMRQQPSVVV